jgi:glycosyltransferase involved in cell wall biosynthesis
VTGLDPARYRPLVVLPDHGPLAADLRAAGIEVLVRPLAVVRRSLMSPMGVRRVVAAWAADAGGLGRLARSRDVALVHTNTSVTLGGAAAARLAGVPHVWHVREIYAGFERWFPAYRRLLLSAQSLPCVSRATCLQFDGAPAAFVLHDGLAVDPRRADRARARAVLGLPADAFVAAVLGRVSGWKGQDVLVSALGEEPLRGLGDVVALAAGEPWHGEERHRRELHARAARLGIVDRLFDVGFRIDLDHVYGAADVVVVPSKQPDPLPNAALEACAAGCCVVAAAHGGLPEIVRDGHTGRLVPPRDPAALAAVLAELADDEPQRARLGAAAARDVRARFAPERLLAEVQALYDRLLYPAAARAPSTAIADSARQAM